MCTDPQLNGKLAHNDDLWLTGVALVGTALGQVLSAHIHSQMPASTYSCRLVFALQRYVTYCTSAVFVVKQSSYNTSFLMQVVFGILGDYMGRKKVYLLTLVIMITATIGQCFRCLHSEGHRVSILSWIEVQRQMMCSLSKQGVL